MRTGGKSELERVLAEQLLRAHPEYQHLRARARGDVIVIESGPANDAVQHLRFRRATVQWWYLEMPTHTGKWERTPYRDSIRELLALVRAQFPWTLEPLE